MKLVAFYYFCAAIECSRENGSDVHSKEINEELNAFGPTDMLTESMQNIPMRPVQMVDTKTQYQKIKSEVDSAVIKVMESSAFINGKAVHDFAGRLSDYLKIKHVIPCANGTDALQ